MSRLLSRFSLFDALFTRLERGGPSDRLLLKSGFFVLVGLGLFLLILLSQNAASVVPVRGGTLTEGIVGVPRFVNPALAITRADQDMVSLVYSGLMRLEQDGQLVPHLAESVTISEDGRTYAVALRRNLSFHDGHPLTAEDVTFTIGLIQNPDLKSPLRGTWNNVSVNVIDEYSLELALEEAYAPFIENLTLGIMPKHIWKDLTIDQLPFSQYNTEPIGAGPFLVADVHRDQNGLIGSYILQRFDEALVVPNLAALELLFFQNEGQLTEALGKREIHASAYVPTAALKDLDTDNYQIIAEPLPRVFGLFFNQNRSIIVRDPVVREALTAAIDREALIEETLLGYGIPTPLPTVPTSSMLRSGEASETTPDSRREAAATILRNGGWTQNSLGLWEKRLSGATETLRLTIRTSNAPLFGAVAEYVAREWRALGADVDVAQFEQADLVQTVIRPRDFTVLLFGMDMSRSNDLYPFWHSSQKDDPGLNVAQYTNITVDQLLTDARTTQDAAARRALLEQAATQIAGESPAVFLFAPELAYVVDKRLTTTPFPPLHRPSDRFVSIATWYVETAALWPFFTKPTPDAS